MSAEANAHLHACEPCRAFSQERAALRLLVGNLIQVSAPPDFDWKLRARLAEARRERGRERRFLTGFAPGARAITVAASITLLLVAVIVYRQTRSLPSNGMQSAVVAGADTKGRASLESENKGLPPVNPQAPVPANVSKGRQQSESNDAARARSIKSGRANTSRTEASRGTAPPPRIFSNDLASRGAEDLAGRKTGDTSTGATPVFSVRLPSATSSQLRFEDGQGTRRTLSPVNFGGQELIERRDKARLVPASDKGIW